MPRGSYMFESGVIMSDGGKPARTTEEYAAELLAQPWRDPGPPPTAAAEWIAGAAQAELPREWEVELPVGPGEEPGWSAAAAVLQPPEGAFTPAFSTIRRRLRKAIWQASHDAEPDRPSSDDPEAMTRALVALITESAVAGSYSRVIKGRPVDSPFNLREWWRGHQQHCEACRRRGPWRQARRSNHLNPCYIGDILTFLHHGVLFPFAAMPAPFAVDSYASLELAPETCEAEFVKMRAAGVLLPVDKKDCQYLNPWQAVIKDADIDAAGVTLGSEVVGRLGDPDEPGFLDRLNAELRGVGAAPVKARLCVDFSRAINDLLLELPFEYPPVDQLLEQLPARGWMQKVDYRRCFLNIPLHPAMHRYLGVSWQGEYFLLRRLLFGISLGPAVCSIFTAESARIYAAELLGWPVNRDKLEEDKPAQRMAYRGIVFDSVASTVSIAPHRLARCTALIEVALSDGFMAVRRWRSLLGHLGWAEQLMPEARPHMAALWEGVHRRLRPAWRFQVSEAAGEELCWWRSRLEAAIAGDGQAAGWARFWEGGWPPITRIFGDAAGDDGFAALVGSSVFVGAWHPELPDAFSSTAKELVGVYYALRAAAPRLPRGSIVLVTTDNQGNAMNFCSGKAGAGVRALFRAIWQLAADHQLHLLGDWIPREFNVFPDALSHLGAAPGVRARLWPSAAPPDSAPHRAP